jgi:hypothetical protein
MEITQAPSIQDVGAAYELACKVIKRSALMAQMELGYA